MLNSGHILSHSITTLIEKYFNSATRKRYARKYLIKKLFPYYNK